MVNLFKSEIIFFMVNIIYAFIAVIDLRSNSACTSSNSWRFLELVCKNNELVGKTN